MSVGELLGRLVAKLDAAGIPHMIAGSFASTYHGTPRATQDIDIVIEATGPKLRALLSSLPDAEYYVDGDAALEAVRQRSQFNVIDMDTGWKIDLILRKERPFSIEEFQRRQSAELFGAEVFVATAEDSVIAKLEWAKLSGSDRQLRDVQGIVASRGASLNLEYIQHWVGELGLEDLWGSIQR